MKRKTISLIVMAVITAVSLLACSFVYTKRLRDRNEMLAQAELSFVNSHQLGFAGNSYQPSSLVSLLQTMWSIPRHLRTC